MPAQGRLLDPEPLRRPAETAGFCCKHQITQLPQLDHCRFCPGFYNPHRHLRAQASAAAKATRPASYTAKARCLAVLPLSMSPQTEPRAQANP